MLACGRPNGMLTLRLRRVRVTGRGQDANRSPVRVAERLVYLAGTVGNSDQAPTVAMRDVAKELHDQLYAAKACADALMAKEVAAFRAGVERR